MRATFLFGAGADSVYGICKGKSFILPLLKGEYESERVQLIGADWGKVRLVAPQSKRVFLQTICSNLQEAEAVFDSEAVKRAHSVYNKVNVNEGDRKEVFQWCSDWYNLLISNDDIQMTKREKNIQKFFYNHMVFFDSLDEKMNDLRNSPVNGNGRRLIAAYWIIFILMLRETYDLPEDFEWCLPNVIDFFEHEMQYEKDTIRNVERSYYSVLSDYINDSKSRSICHIATTNYTPIVENTIKQTEPISYLHGRLNWFEDYKNLTVYDCAYANNREEAKRNKDHLFPFILIPSGVKPIICTRQIQEFSRFINDLYSSDILFVVGYKFNSEDNHINSLIAEWLRQENKELVYFNYGDQDDQFLNFDRLLWAKPFDKHLISINIDGRIERSIHVMPKAKILDVQINKVVGIDRFEEVIHILDRIYDKGV